MKRTSLSILLLLLLPAVLAGWLLLTQAGLSWSYQLAASYLPAELSLDKIEGRLIGPLIVHKLHYRQHDSVIEADQLSLDWQPLSLLTAAISINQLSVKNLLIQLPPPQPDEPAAAAETVITLPEINLPWRLLLDKAQIDGISIRRGQQLYELQTLSLSASTLLDQIFIKQLQLKAQDYSLEISGKLRSDRLYSHDLTMSWQARLPSANILKGQGQLSGDLNSSRLQQQLQGPLQLELNAEIRQPLSQLRWQAELEVSAFDSRLLVQSWPAITASGRLEAEGDLDTALLSGKVDGRYDGSETISSEFKVQRLADNRLQIEQLSLHTADSKGRLEGSGFWLPAADGDEFELALDWQNLRWPLLPEALPWFDSSQGNGRISGSIDDYQITLNSDRPWPQIPASSWSASASGNKDGLAIDSLQIVTLDGEINASGQLKWSPLLSWQAQIRATDIDPASLLPDWPGRLNATISSSGSMRDGQLVGEADIQQLDGQLRGYPLTMTSALRWQHEQLHISALELRSEQSLIRLDGAIGQKLKLDWQLDSTRLGELFPEAGGELKARGNLTGPLSTPLLESTFSGKSLVYADNTIASIDGELVIDLFSWQKIEIRLAALSLQAGDYQLQSLNIDTESERLTVSAVGEQLKTQIAVRGKAVSTGWRGHIEQIDIDSERFDSWRLKTPVAIALSEKSLVMDPLCLLSSDSASVCFSLSQQATGWHSQLQLDQLPLNLFSPWLPADLELDGRADGSAELRLLTAAATAQLRVDANINLSAGAILYPLLDNEQQRSEYRDGELQLRLNADGLKSSLSLNMNNDNQLHAQLALPGYQPLAGLSPEQSLQAQLEIRASDLRLLESLFAEIDRPQGELELQLSAGGSIGEPLLSGHANIKNGSLLVPGLGLDINEITLSSRTTSSKKLVFNITARSGNGNLSLDGNTGLEPAAGWPTVMEIRGDNFQVANISEARLQVSPDLKIKIQQRNIDISGDVHVPYAKLQPKDTTRAATVSSDAVIVSGGESSEEKWLISSSVRLTLGDRVTFYGFGFEGRLGGNLLLQDEPGQLTRATGVITIPEGTYRAYGQRLEIEQGRILYTGGPLSNPGLDVRAVRKVNTVTAGIHVKGSLSQPRLEIFSTPAMGQTDALAYLILGGPLENADSEEGAMMAKAALALGLAGGDQIARSLGDRFGLDDMRVESSDTGDQAELVVGRYLSPRLYASYGVGLIESINTLTLRYQVSDKWQIKVESGEAQGADILFTIDR